MNLSIAEVAWICVTHARSHNTTLSRWISKLQSLWSISCISHETSVVTPWNSTPFVQFPLEHMCMILACFLHHSHWCHLHSYYINHMYVSWFKAFEHWQLHCSWASHIQQLQETGYRCVAHVDSFLPTLGFYHFHFPMKGTLLLLHPGHTALNCHHKWKYNFTTQCLHIVKNPRPVVHFCKWSRWKQTWFLHLHLLIHC